jgi:hypothetical protein
MPLPIATFDDKSSESNAATSQTGTTESTQPTTSNTSGKTPEQEEADRLYEERMEDEYAKREGGA